MRAGYRATLGSCQRGGTWEQLLFLVTHHEGDLVRATWGDYIPSFTLDAQGIAVALVIGAALWLVYLAISAALSALLRSSRSPSPRR